MCLTNEHVWPKIVAKIKIYILTRAELLINLCHEIPCTSQKRYIRQGVSSILYFFEVGTFPKNLKVVWNHVTELRTFLSFFILRAIKSTLYLKLHLRLMAHYYELNILRLILKKWGLEYVGNRRPCSLMQVHKNKNYLKILSFKHCTEVRFASFLSGGFITAILVNLPERKQAKCTSVHCVNILLIIHSK